MNEDFLWSFFGKPCRFARLDTPRKQWGSVCSDGVCISQLFRWLRGRAVAAPRARVTPAAFYYGGCAAFRSPARKEEGPGFKTRG
jgi:hypothetical protein